MRYAAVKAEKNAVSGVLSWTRAYPRGPNRTPGESGSMNGSIPSGACSYADVNRKDQISFIQLRGELPELINS